MSETGEIETFDREELQEIRTRALKMSMTVRMNSTLMRAYIDLADTVDRLDAMQARAEITCGALAPAG